MLAATSTATAAAATKPAHPLSHHAIRLKEQRDAKKRLEERRESMLRRVVTGFSGVYAAMAEETIELDDAKSFGLMLMNRAGADGGLRQAMSNQQLLDWILKHDAVACARRMAGGLKYEVAENLANCDPVTLCDPSKAKLVSTLFYKAATPEEGGRREDAWRASSLRVLMVSLEKAGVEQPQITALFQYMLRDYKAIAGWTHKSFVEFVYSELVRWSGKVAYEEPCLVWYAEKELKWLIAPYNIHEDASRVIATATESEVTLPPYKPSCTESTARRILRARYTHVEAVLQQPCKLRSGATKELPQSLINEILSFALGLAVVSQKKPIGYQRPIRPTISITPIPTRATVIPTYFKKQQPLEVAIPAVVVESHPRNQPHMAVQIAEPMLVDAASA